MSFIPGFKRDQYRKSPYERRGNGVSFGDRNLIFQGSAAGA
jgi:hypothetical protein